VSVIGSTITLSVSFSRRGFFLLRAGRPPIDPSGSVLFFNVLQGFFSFLIRASSSKRGERITQTSLPPPPFLLLSRKKKKPPPWAKNTLPLSVALATAFSGKNYPLFPHALEEIDTFLLSRFSPSPTVVLFLYGTPISQLPPFDRERFHSAKLFFFSLSLVPFPWGHVLRLKLSPAAHPP